MADVLRVVVFSSLEFEDRDWAGPTLKGELITYEAQNDAASLKVTHNNQVVFDKDFRSRKVITIDGNVIHLPEGAISER